jgi:hypothetical protein
MPKKGGKLKASEIKDFLQASYDETPPKDLDGYVLDSSLSSATAKVYYNPQTGHAVVAHRGTKGIMDWGNNLAYTLGYYDYTPRYKKGKSTQDKAEKKYGKQNISTLGHSQGAIIARKTGGDTQEVINVNPAYSFERPKKNEYNIRSSSDIVSGLYAPVAKAREVLYPNYSKKHDITIPSQSATDVLEEHSYRILDRLGDTEIGVGAGNKISSNNIMKCGGRRTKELGFQADDIDWLGGSQGTAYINRGTNPYGTRGAGFHDGHSSVDKYFKPPKGLRRGKGRDEDSSSDEEIEGGKMKNPFKSVGKAFDKAGDKMNTGMAKVATAINPMTYVLGSKTGRNLGIGLGDATNNYLLPAVVSAGKPIYDATAMTASTMLTGNPMLGKVAADTLWNEMVAKKGYDPRERQKSKELGELSGVAGEALAKPYSAALGGNIVADEFRRRDRQRRIPMEGAGLMDTLRSLYNYINPPESFETWRARRQSDRITKAEEDFLRRMERAKKDIEDARRERASKIKSAKEYGVFENIPITDELRQVGENIRMGVEDIGSRLSRQERKIEEEDPEWAMNGRGRKMKGGIRRNKK